MPHCYQCDRLVADLSSRSRCVDCECNRSKANEAENDQLRSRLAELEGQEPVAIEFQHEETGQIGSVDLQQVEWGFFKNNPRLQEIGPLYRHPAPPAVPVAWMNQRGDVISDKHKQDFLKKAGIVAAATQTNFSVGLVPAKAAPQREGGAE